MRRCCVSSVSGRFFRHVATLCFKCFNCFRYMFQLFHADVAKVDRNVACIAMLVHVCCKRLYLMFHLFFVHVCCKCFKCTSQVFHVSSFMCCKCCIWMFKSRSGCYTCCNGVSTVCYKCFICFRRMLQRFYPDVAKVDRAVA